MKTQVCLQSLQHERGSIVTHCFDKIVDQLSVILGTFLVQKIDVFCLFWFLGKQFSVVRFLYFDLSDSCSNNINEALGYLGYVVLIFMFVKILQIDSTATGTHLYLPPQKLKLNR